jgi:hypothetical protein
LDSDEPQHLAALLEIVERHRPIAATHPVMARVYGHFYCGAGDEWPNECVEFLAIERCLGLGEARS